MASRERAFMEPSDLMREAHCLNRQEMNVFGGCQCKMAGTDLEDMLASAEEWASRVTGRPLMIPRPSDCSLIEYFRLKLLFTTDHSPPVGIDLFKSGRIAALHAMSDVYASGGVPKWALVNLTVGSDRQNEQPTAIMAGILSECSNLGVDVVGGHTVIGRECMVGITVIGVPRADCVLTKNGAMPGDILMISKPLGSGLILRSYKLGLLHEADLEAAISVMLVSNATASSSAVNTGVHASTDVTGFGLLGHLAEMLQPNLGARITLSEIPVLQATKKLPLEALHTTWLDNNWRYATDQIEISGISDFARIGVLLDPQTNGGLLVSVPSPAVDTLQSCGFQPIGTVTSTKTIEVAP